MPWEYWRWRLVREFGWTLAEVDALSMADFHEWYQVSDGEGKGQSFTAKARVHGSKGR